MDNYLKEMYNLGIRVCSVNENYDNFAVDRDFQHFEIPLRNIINDLYAKDISRKISSTIHSNMQNGKYKKSKIPYGYDVGLNGELVVCNFEAVYIRLIFKWKIDGVSISDIVDRLNKIGIRSPSGQGEWLKGSLNTILGNRSYVGDTVFARNSMVLCNGVRKNSVNHKGKWIVFPDTHEAIISRQDFCVVQEILKKSSLDFKAKMDKSESIRAEFVDFLEDKMFCGDCGKKMYFFRKKNYSRSLQKDVWFAHYMCGTYSQNTRRCNAHYVRQEVVNDIICEVIALYMNLFADNEACIKNIKNIEKCVSKKACRGMASLKLRKNGVENKMEKLYINLCEGNIDREEYLRKKNELQKELNVCNNEMTEKTGKNFDSWGFIHCIVDKVVIYSGKRIEIVMKCGDNFVLD